MVRGVVAICPSIMPQRTEIVTLHQALPEIMRPQPSTMPREVMTTKKYQHKAFATEFAAQLAAPVRCENDTEDWGRLSLALAAKPAVVIESGDGSGTCCACCKNGALGRCSRCGLLMHYGCVQPILPGRPQPCPVCDVELRGGGEPPTLYPHELEVGVPRRRESLPFVGLETGDAAARPLEGVSLPTDEEVRAEGYADMKDCYARTIAPSLRGSPALSTELQILRDAEIKYDEEDVLLAMREPCDGELEGESVQGYPTDAQFRPFFIGDADVSMRERFDRCCVLRSELAADAAKT